jgi:hypothetical protein
MYHLRSSPADISQPRRPLAIAVAGIIIGDTYRHLLHRELIHLPVG